MDFIDYRERLGIGFENQELERLFFNRIFSVLDGLFPSDQYDLYGRGNQISKNEYSDFCMQTGCIIKYNVYSGQYWDRIIEVLHSNSQTIKEFLPYYMYFINCQKDANIKMYTREYFKNLVCKMLKLSHIPYELLEENGDYFIFPKGADELDKALVSEPLEWLREYPQAYKTYCIALKQYSEGIYIRDVADNLRKTLEAFLQEFLGNTKNLETNKNEICRYLGEKGVDAGISGLFQPLINSYKNINDRIAKHNDAIDEKLLEFLLYQTGVLIRMVITVENGGQG